MRNLVNYPIYKNTSINFQLVYSISFNSVSFDIAENTMEKLNYGIFSEITDVVTAVSKDLSEGKILVIFKVINTYKAWENRGQKPLDPDVIVIR